jgi:hypothetical protein
MAYERPEPHSGGELGEAPDSEAAVAKLRASHRDRARAVRRLQEAGLAGRLDPEEVDERTTAAMTARTLGDLAELVSDLPGGSPLTSIRAEPHRDRIGSELYTAKRDGHWTVPAQLDVQVDGGSVVLDFTEAEITSPTLDIEAMVRGGSLTLITKPGIDVHTRDLMAENGTVKVDAPWADDDTPASPVILTITVTGSVIVGDMTARPPRRNLKEWLRGDPRPYTTGP